VARFPFAHGERCGRQLRESFETAPFEDQSIRRFLDPTLDPNAPIRGETGRDAIIAL
jgi:hypothetical protein